MGTNVEIKARAADFARQQALAESMADEGPTELVQVDTFFNVPRGRLKMRQFADGSAELIQYFRADESEPKLSDYIIYDAPAPSNLKQLLHQALGTRGVVSKRRILYLVKNTRIHFDEVEGLGQFIELEVVLSDSQSSEEGRLIAAELCASLGILPQHLLRAAYIDMLETESQDD